MAPAATRIAAFVAVTKGCTAFVPQVGLRGQPTLQESAAAVAAAAAPAQEPSALASATSLLGAAAASALVYSAAARVAGSRRSAPRTARPALGKSGSLGLTGTVGICAPLTEKFDPLNLGSTDAKMERYTAVEIKHGRVAMIACVGYVMPEALKFPGCENFENGLTAFDTIPVEGWVQMVAFIGAHEILVKPRQGGLGSYDFGLGTELIADVDPEELERRQTVERNNGRLAMIGIFGLMVQDGMFGMSPFKYMRAEGWWGSPVDFIVKDIPLCRIGCALPREKGHGRALTAMRAIVYDDPIPLAPGDEEPEMSVACPFLKYPQPLKGWVGGEKGFDPMNITMALPPYLVREAELKHGRVCMLATVGWIATDLGARFPSEFFQSLTPASAHNACVDAGYMQPFLGLIGCIELYSGWLLVQGQSGDLKRDAGDFFVGKQFLPKDADKANDMKLKEIENGRLAMVAFSGIVTQAVAFEKGFPYF